MSAKNTAATAPATAATPEARAAIVRAIENEKKRLWQLERDNTARIVVLESLKIAPAPPTLEPSAHERAKKFLNGFAGSMPERAGQGDAIELRERLKDAEAIKVALDHLDRTEIVGRGALVMNLLVKLGPEWDEKTSELAHALVIVQRLVRERETIRDQFRAAGAVPSLIGDGCNLRGGLFGMAERRRFLELCNAAGLTKFSRREVDDAP